MRIARGFGVRSLAAGLARHAEKIALGIAVTFLVVSTCRSVSRRGLGWTPAELTDLTAAAVEHLRSTEPQVPSAARCSDLLQRTQRAVSEEPYAFEVPLSSPFRLARTRSTPEVLPVQDLQASAGHGVFAMSAAGPEMQTEGTGRRGQRWIAVSGVIPHRQQIEAFQDVFAQTPYRDPARDRPSYAHFHVERAEIEPRRELGEPTWMQQPMRAMLDEQHEWRDAEQDHLLFRYFDYDVEPDKCYRYRVKLLLDNPNFGVAPHRLADAAMASALFLESGWSEPSLAVTVPSDTQVAVLAVRRPRHEATLRLVRLDIDAGTWTRATLRAQRGQLLAFRNPSVDMTGMLLLDVSGGRRLPGRSRLTEPASVLLLDAQGRLIVRSELDETPETWQAVPGNEGRPEPGTLAGRMLPGGDEAASRSLQAERRR